MKDRFPPSHITGRLPEPFRGRIIIPGRIPADAAGAALMANVAEAARLALIEVRIIFNPATKEFTVGHSEGLRAVDEMSMIAQAFRTRIDKIQTDPAFSHNQKKLLDAGTTTIEVALNEAFADQNEKERSTNGTAT